MHYRKTWGEPARQPDFRVAGLVAEVLKWDRAATGEEVTLYTTLGASERPLSATNPRDRVEFFLGLQPERDEVASSLAALALYPTREHVALAHGHTVPAAEPLWRGTGMHHFLVVHPLTRIIEPVELGDGVHVDFLQVIPIFESELAYKAKHRAEGLLDLWKQRHVKFWDPERSAQPADEI